MLTDQARARQSHKRGGGVQPISLDEALFVSAMFYMLSWRQHLMLFLPEIDPEASGANLQGAPVHVEEDPGPLDNVLYSGKQVVGRNTSTCSRRALRECEAARLDPGALPASLALQNARRKLSPRTDAAHTTERLPSMRQYGFSSQSRIVALLNRCVEGIHVGMDDFADTHMVTMFFRAAMSSLQREE